MVQKTLVVGAGPVGSLAALYAAKRGHEVHIYELRSDLRDPSTVPLGFTKSINLALSERGINAMRHSDDPKLLEHVFASTIPMAGRMIHTADASGNSKEEAQQYDVHGRPIFAVDRANLNGRLLDILEDAPNVTFHFNHKLISADFQKRIATFEDVEKGKKREETNVQFDFMIGADGAHSAVRNNLMKFTRMDYEQKYIDTLWCEFHIDANEVGKGDDERSKFRISPNHLHIWPGREFMFIAIPCSDGSFTCTLFLPSTQFSTLEENPTLIPTFFNQHFPGVTALVPPSSLIDSFNKNPHLPLITIKCTPYHFGSSVVILGDAAHAMVPFYGQGMNAGLEDVRILFGILDKHAEADFHTTSNSLHPQSTPDDSDSDKADDEDDAGKTAEVTRHKALAEYTLIRTPDAHAINDLALQNYVEMRAEVLSPMYRVRKMLEEMLTMWVPGLGWQTKYSRVSFGNERYSEVVGRSERQGRVLVRGFVGVMVSPFLVWGLLVGWRGRGLVGGVVRGLVRG